jgi:hypothetical protein
MIFIRRVVFCAANPCPGSGRQPLDRFLKLLIYSVSQASP